MKNISNKQSQQTLVLSDQDIAAVLCALPLVSYYDTGDAIQNKLNASFIETASRKLALHNSNFLQDELMVIYSSISLAVNLSTFLPDADIDAEWKHELQTHFFTLNKLYNLRRNQLPSE